MPNRWNRKADTPTWVGWENWLVLSQAEYSTFSTHLRQREVTQGPSRSLLFKTWYKKSINIRCITTREWWTVTTTVPLSVLLGPQRSIPAAPEPDTPGRRTVSIHLYGFETWRFEIGPEMKYEIVSKTGESQMNVFHVTYTAWRALYRSCYQRRHLCKKSSTSRMKRYYEKENLPAKRKTWINFSTIKPSQGPELPGQNMWRE